MEIADQSESPGMTSKAFGVKGKSQRKDELNKALVEEYYTLYREMWSASRGES